MSDVVIKVENLSKVYKLYDKPIDRLKESLNPFRKKYHHDFYALKDIDFEIKKGETVGIIGANGAGKSTLLKILTGVLTPTTGKFSMDGRVSSLLELGTGFNPEITGIENIYFYGTINGYTKGDMDKIKDDIISFADIGEYINQPLKTYSSGMMARLAFAVAVQVQPEILIIDEALSVGDIRFQLKAMRKMEEMINNSKAILFVSHDIDSIRRICKRCIWLKNGFIYKDGDSQILSQQYHAFMAHGIFPDDSTDDSIKEDIVKDTEIEESPVNKNIDFDILPENISTSGEGGIKITGVALYTVTPFEKTYNLSGGEEVVFMYKFKTFVDIDTPLISFIVYDDKGQPLFGSNSYTLEKNYNLIQAQKEIEVRFNFKFPILRNGKYVFSVGIADGIQEKHIRLLVVFDAYIINLFDSSIRKKQGLLFNLENIDMDIN